MVSLLAFVLASMAFVNSFGLPSRAMIFFMFTYFVFLLIDSMVIKPIQNNDLKNEIQEELDEQKN